MNKTKKSLLMSAISLLLCISMLIGSTFAWFTDSVTSAGNKIQSGTLKVDLELLDKETGKWNSLKESQAPIFNYDKWEPGYIDTKVLKVENEGNLALKWVAKFYSEYQLSILADVIDVYVRPSASEIGYPTDRNLEGYTCVGNLRTFINSIEETTWGTLEAKEASYLGIALKMREEAGNEYQGLSLGGAFDIRIYATQYTSESDSFNNQYDKNATFEDLANTSILATATKTLAAGANSLDFDLSYNGLKIAKVIVPAGAIANTAEPVTVTFDGINPSQAAIVDDNTQAYSYDIKVTNLKDNLVGDQLITVVVTAPNALAAMKAYHNGKLIENAVYDEVEGTITFKTASFSPYDFTYQEKKAATLEELRAAVKESNVEIKLTEDLDINLEDGSADRSEDHKAKSTDGKTMWYNAVNIVGENVAIDLNGHKITVKCSDAHDGNQDVGALFFVDKEGSLNIIDRKGGGFIKMESSIYMVWAPFNTPSYMDIYGGAFIADGYAGDPIGTPIDKDGNHDFANGSMKNENSNRALVYAGTGGNMNIYGGYFLYNNTPNDIKNRNNGAFNCTNGYEGDRPFITIHDGVMLIDKAYRQDPTYTSVFQNILKENPNAEPTDPGILDNSSIKLEESCEIVKVEDQSATIDGTKYNTWYRVTSKKPVSLTVAGLQESYAVGDSLNLTVTATYSYGFKTLSAGEYTIVGADMSTIGAKVITISYTEKGKTVETTLQTKVVAVTGIYAEAKTERFELGKPVPNNNFIVYATANDGSIVEISEFNVSGLNANTAGTQQAIITYGGYTTTCNITFVDIPNLDTSGSMKVKFWNGNVGVFGSSLTSQVNIPRGDSASTPLLGGLGESATRVKVNGKYYDGNLYNNIMGTPVTLNDAKGYIDFSITDAHPSTWVGIVSNIGFEKKIVDAGYYFDNDMLSYESCTVNGGFVNQHWSSEEEAKSNGYWVQIYAGTRLDDFELNDAESHVVKWVVKFEDGKSVVIGEWTFKMAQLSGDMFEETDKPNANVIILAGQSNATGHAPLTQAIKNEAAKYDFSNIYINYKTSDGSNFTHAKQSNKGFDQYVPGMSGWVNPNAVDAEYFGPELGLAEYIAASGLKNERWYIIKYSVCGSGLASDWLGGKNYAQDMLNFVNNAVGKLSETYDVKISGFLWMQGETDAMNQTAANAYAQNEQTLVSMVRNKFAKYATRMNNEPGSGITFVDMQIATKDYGPNWTYAETVNKAKYNNCSNWVSGYYGQSGSLTPGAGWGTNASAKIANALYVETVGYTYKWQATNEHAQYTVTGDTADTDHYSAESMRSIGADKFGIGFEYMYNLYN